MCPISQSLNKATVSVAEMVVDLSNTYNTSAVEAGETDKTTEFPKVTIGASQDAVRAPQRLSQSCNNSR